MTHTHAFRASSHRLAFAALCAVLAVSARAQTAPAQQQPAGGGASQTPPVTTTASSSDSGSAVVQLNPFEVKTEKDKSYGALNSNSITSFNMELSKTPVVADIMTSAFIKDTGATTLDDLLRGYGNGVGMVFATPESDSTALQPGARFSSAQYAIRGLTGSSARRDGFQVATTAVNYNNIFDVEQVDIIHGSQGLLYGPTGAGGVINVVSKQANFSQGGVQTNGEVTSRIDQYGSQLGTFDVNVGLPNVAGRFVALSDSQQTRFLYAGGVTTGYFGALAFKLPFNTILRVMDEETHNKNISTNTTTPNFGGTSVDPRSGLNMGYLMVTNQLGAINPATGQPYPGGAIDNGHVNPSDYLSWSGWADEEDTDNNITKITMDSAWTSWLSTSFGILYNKSQEMRNTNLGNLFAPLAGGNPLNSWAESTSWANSENPDRKKEYRASALVTNDFFHGIAHSQSSVGFDRIYDDSSGGIAYQYYLANPDGTVSFDPTKTNGGRTQIATAFWPVPNGPVEYPLPKAGSKTIVWNGQLYTRQVSNPRSPAWITPNNPLGLASLYAASLNNSLTNTNGISGGNSGGFANQSRLQGWYIDNYTGWWNDAIDTLVGMRASDSLSRTPNTSANLPQAWTEVRSKTFYSWTGGLNFKIPYVSWLHGYVAYSRNFNATNGSNDAYGNIPLNPAGYTYEAGLKFDRADGRLSGSISAFTGYAENDNYNAGTTYENTVNPTGISGLSFTNGQGSKNQWAQFNKTSRGLEAILTAAPTDNWRIRFSASLPDGTVKNSSSYAMLYNDQFSTDGKGNVTYANGQPFLVPTDATTLAKVQKLSTATNPTTFGVPLTQLTVAMINDPTSPWYAFGQGTTAANQPINGSIGQPVGGAAANPVYLKQALQFFTNGGTFAYTGVTGLPLSSMQYNFADPAGLHGIYTVQAAGDRVVGTPALSVNLTNDYTIPSGPLEGLGIGGSVSGAWYNAQFYYRTADNRRHLFGGPIAPDSTVNTWIKYTRKFRKVTWESEVNINNMFNHYVLAINPSVTTGFANPSGVSATYYGVPRGYVWTNRLDF